MTLMSSSIQIQSYYRGTPKIDKLIFKIMPSSNLVAQLETGEIDMVHPGIGVIPVQDHEKVKSIKHINTIKGGPFNYQLMLFNTNVFTDEKVRLAIVHALNRPMIVDTLLGGGEIVDSNLTTIHPYYNDDVAIHDYDPEKAKQLLKEANWKFDKPIDLAVPTGNQIREQTASIIAENLKAVGFDVQINKYDLPTIMQKGGKQEFDLLSDRYTSRIDPNRSFAPFYEKTGFMNYGKYNNPKIDQLIEEGRVESDPEKRKVIYDEVQEILHNDLPMISLYADYAFKPVSQKMIVGEPKSMGMFYDVHEWEIRKLIILCQRDIFYNIKGGKKYGYTSD